MRRSKRIAKGQVLKGEVKRSKFQTIEKSSKSPPEFNPFLVEPILVKFLKLVNRVSQLKELRKVCQTWDQYILKELEDRAFKGKIYAIDFIWTDKFNTKSEAEANLVQFLWDTQSIPRLFSSFIFNFPESWTILQNHMEFFSIYPVTFVYLFIPSYLAKRPHTRAFFTKFIETKIWSNFKEITIYTSDHNGRFGLPSSSTFIPFSGPIPNKLKILNIKESTPEIFKLFEIIHSSGKNNHMRYMNLKAMMLPLLPRGKLHFPGFDLSKLTYLEIGELEPKNSTIALKFTSGLLNLAQKGMKLKFFGMHINVSSDRILETENNELIFQNLRFICSNLTQFLTSQASTIRRMSFIFVCLLYDRVGMPEGADWFKIYLPQFEVLRILKLGVIFSLYEPNLRTSIPLFVMTQSLAVHFPKLMDLTLEGVGSLIALKNSPTGVPSGGLELKRFQILDTNNSRMWKCSFVDIISSVEVSKCPAIHLYGQILPWGESLRALYIYDINFGIENLKLNLNHFKKLKILHIHCFEIRQNRIYDRSENEKNFEDFLNIFEEATELSLAFIKFKFKFIDPNVEEEVKEEFIQYFPFPVEFKSNP